jgi:cell division septation protein DedD
MNYNMTTTTTTKTTKVITALENGSELTAKQITARYGVKNVRALMSSLRMQGYPVYLNKRVSSFDGETYNKYRLGTATRAVIAAGYRALAQGV